MNVATALPHSLEEIFKAFAQQEAFDRGAGFHRMNATDNFFVGGGCEVFRIERPFPNISICQPFILSEWQKASKP